MRASLGTSSLWLRHMLQEWLEGVASMNGKCRHFVETYIQSVASFNEKLV